MSYSDMWQERSKGNVNLDPPVISEDPGLLSMTHGDLSAASSPLLLKSKTVILTPAMLKEFTFSVPP